MFPLWDIVIAPVIRASDARRVVEIGALRGDTTMRLLDLLGPETQVDVIDPEPDFNPAIHERRFPGRYVFHRDISHNVLPHLDSPDVALIDGDHNWFTVNGELRLLRETARRTGAMLPVLILHDVGWPCGRRDLYYDPACIPEEFRQPHRRAGILPGVDTPVDVGGVNPVFDNALSEGGPRNGVMTALEDFIAEHDRPLRRVVLPIYHGLAILAEEERLAAQPELAAALDRLESAECRYELLELSESLRIKLMVEKSELMARFDLGSVDRLVERYLDTLKGALLDEHNLENEARLEYLMACNRNGMEPDWARLRDPAWHLRGELRSLQHARRTGSTPSEAPEAPSFPYAAMGAAHLDHLGRCLDTINGFSVEGDLVECGVGRGGGAIFMRGFLEAHDVRDRQVWAVDEFASPAQIDPAVNGAANQLADLNMVRTGFARFGLLDEQVRFLQGPVPETLADAPIEQVAVLRIDSGLAGSPAEILELLYDRVSVGGFVVIDGYGSPRCREAVEAFRIRRGVEDMLERIDDRAVYWRKLSPAAAPSTRAAEPRRGHAPLAPPLPESPCELSVIVVLHNMRREAERTLHSLSRAYQREAEDLDYEVVVVENGSTEDQRVGEDRVRSFGPEFRYLDLGADASPSPAQAANRGIELARGEVIALMVDGAHVLTPRVLHFGMLGIRNHEPAIVATQQWYVGPGQQATTIHEGYDRELEDALFGQIKWPADGYRLFEIGHFIGRRDWLDGLWESNCVFAPRPLLEQVGGMDESFSMPGGGFTNLDLYERLGATPGVNIVTMLGEGSFHQVHGGTTTNQSNVDAPLIPSYRQHYAELRRRPYRWVGKPLHYIGSMTEAALRTRPRRRGAVAFTHTAYELEADGRPRKPVPLPEELQAEFTDAYWRSFRWRRTTWLGHSVAKSPSDLLAYQELIVSARPDWVIETPSEDGGRALFLASVCELLGHGRVLSIDRRPGGELPEHPRLTYLAGDPLEEATLEAARRTVGEPPRALVVFGLAPRDWLRTAFDLYAPFVPEGSGVVFEDTIMNGRPVWPAMGPGPAEAVGLILDDYTDFELDPRMTQLTPTFNPGGYLRRLS